MASGRILFSMSVILGALSGCREEPSATPCEDLARLQFPDTTLTRAENGAAGAFVPPKDFPWPGGTPPEDFIPYKDLPSFCRVAASIRPTADSDIQLEVWMPEQGWNEKFAGVGNGGFWGEIMYPQMSEPLTRGYAVASTDTGHEGAVDDGSFAVGHPEKLVDHGYRAIHEMTVKAKAIIAERYGDGPRQSYWLGCSTGGRQGLMEAQRFPDDYDGISSGAPANNWVPLMASGVWITAALTEPAGGLRALDFDRDVARAIELEDGVLAATEPDLTAFAARGGKLFLWHGWNDTMITPRNTIH